MKKQQTFSRVRGGDELETGGYKHGNNRGRSQVRSAWRVV